MHISSKIHNAALFIWPIITATTATY